jgi:hypothetical protein
LFEHIMLIVHADMPPDADDWARMSVVRNANASRLRGTLVVAPPRAAINAAQRAEVASFMKMSGSSVAVLTDSALIRGVARAVAFLNLNVRAFEPVDIGAALNFLLLADVKHKDAIRRVEMLKAQLVGRTSKLA